MTYHLLSWEKRQEYSFQAYIILYLMLKVWNIIATHIWILFIVNVVFLAVSRCSVLEYYPSHFTQFLIYHCQYGGGSARNLLKTPIIFHISVYIPATSPGIERRNTAAVSTEVRPNVGQSASQSEKRVCVSHGWCIPDVGCQSSIGTIWPKPQSQKIPLIKLSKCDCRPLMGTHYCHFPKSI